MNLSFKIYLEANTAKDKLKNDDNLSFFFIKDKDVFAGDEGTRINFARLKSGEDKKGEVFFSAINLKKAIKGEPPEHIFKDLKNIKIITKDEAFK